jgi:3-hydroxyacyl-[acyl-carrier-protein] dehydratase
MVRSLGIEKVLWVKKGQGIAAQGQIPEDAEFFQDHFPGFPVLPGVLAIEMLRQTAEAYFRAISDGETNRLKIKKVSAVKFSNYLKPGDAWESHLQFLAEDRKGSQWNARLLHRGQAAVRARLTLEAIGSDRTLAVSKR